MKKILIVVSYYYEEVARGLVEGATNILDTNNYKFEIKEAPGAFEIPFIINKYKNKFDGYIALGCVVRGETFHFEIICNEVTRKIMDLSIDINKPIGFGIITCDNIEQAIKRSSSTQNKGAEAAKACQKLLDDLIN
tara:strand:+ start:3610 stop:4017 length:408 start_codon:yes stop_codon:yes gene_type:complete